jgi:phosphohistidine phosphatase
VRLWLLRHAKSSWRDDALADAERPLAPRGERAAAGMASFVAEHAIHPELVLCSTALRARQTLDRVRGALGAPVVSVEPGLYAFDPEPLIERLREVADDVSSVLLVGHNPAMHELAVWAAREGDRLAELTAKYPTGALAELNIDRGPWASLAPGCAVLTRFVPPRELS